MKQKLDTQVATAVGAMLVGRASITLEEVAAALPGHIRAASPSLKAMTKALAGAGWIGERHPGGAIVYVPPRDDDGGDDPRHNGDGGSDAAADEVREFIDRAERLLDAKKDIADDIKDFWSEVKSRGHDASALQQIIRMRARKPDEQQARDAILEVYLKTLGMMA